MYVVIWHQEDNVSAPCSMHTLYFYSILVPQKSWSALLQSQPLNLAWLWYGLPCPPLATKCSQQRYRSALYFKLAVHSELYPVPDELTGIHSVGRPVCHLLPFEKSKEQGQKFVSWVFLKLDGLVFWNTTALAGSWSIHVVKHGLMKWLDFAV